MDNPISKFDVSALRDIAIFLEGIKYASKDTPIGREQLKSLWKAHSLLKEKSSIHCATNQNLYNMLSKARNDIIEHGGVTTELLNEMDAVLTEYRKNLMF